MNTATAEESAAASEELSSQAEMLKSMISRFKLKKTFEFKGKAAEIDPEMISVIENIISRKRNKTEIEEDKAISEAAAAQSRIRIELDDKDFGKY